MGRTGIFYEDLGELEKLVKQSKIEGLKRWEKTYGDNKMGYIKNLVEECIEVSLNYFKENYQKKEEHEDMINPIDGQVI